ncbi:MAG: response regulator transcription factor [Anaerolineales bacterium]|nr:response regulator transcription factor [Anaerolineales bacterium]
MITIVLGEDHQIVRQGLRALLEEEEGIQVIGEAGDGLEVLDLVEQLEPDILVVDLMMPGLHGLEITRQVRNRSRRTLVVVLSMHADESYVIAALKNGASGYVLKDSSASDLVTALREVSDGRRFLSSPLSDRAIEVYMKTSDDNDEDVYECLTNREREILQLAAEGDSNRTIGERLSISPRTVETHRANLMRKLGLKTQTDLIRFALRRGILPLEE